MKYCPTCGLTYSDNSFEFCLQDGANLVDEPNSAALTPTISLSESNNIINDLKRKSIEAENVNNNAWQSPPPPINDEPVAEPAQMSEIATLGNIFFEPGRTFEDLRRKPRFILVTLLIIAFAMTFQILFLNKMGDERLKRAVVEQIDKSSQTQSLSPEEKQQRVDLGMKFQGFAKYVIPVFIIIFFLIGGLIYWGGSSAMGGSITFLGALSVWVYSSFPPLFISTIANISILLLKSADDIDVTEAQSGLVHANLGFLLDGKSMPVLTTIVSLFDVFAIWSLILAVIGLQKVGKISKGAAWGIVILVTLIGVSFRILGAVSSGNPN
jgi:hypothetical protein